MSSPASIAALNDSGAPAGASAAAPRLLIVDDVEDNRAVLARRFQRRNFEVCEAECGASALELIERRSFDLILLDIMMPDITGVDVLRPTAGATISSKPLRSAPTTMSPSRSISPSRWPASIRRSSENAALKPSNE
jgi:hypothetical protein